MSELVENAITLHDNTKAHSADTVENVFWHWGWEVLEYLSYSPNLNPCNCDLIHKLKQPLHGKRFAHIQNILTAVQQEVAEILFMFSAFPVIGHET